MKRVIVTDPCYLISDKDWSKLIKEAEQDSGKDWIDCFDNIVAKYLAKISGSHAVAGSTGFGDWVNEIGGEEFGADSGMVCVVELTTEFKKYMEKEDISVMPGLAALVAVSDDVDYEIDRKDPHWSVVRIKSGNEIIESLPSEES